MALAKPRGSDTCGLAFRLPRWAENPCASCCARPSSLSREDKGGSGPQEIPDRRGKAKRPAKWRAVALVGRDVLEPQLLSPEGLLCFPGWPIRPAWT